MKRYLKISTFLILLSVLSWHLLLADSKKLTIVFSGDTRGEIENCHCPKDDFGGLPRRAKYIEGVRDKAGEILLLDAGDVLPLETPDVDEEQISEIASVSFKAMDIMGYDAMNVGESDLILGESFLEKLSRDVSFPLISANIVNKYTKEPFFKPYVILETGDGLKVGITGVVNERYFINSDNLEITDHKEAIVRILPELRAASDIVILLSHIGLPYSIELAESVDGIDVILSGHWDVDSQKPIEIRNTLIMPTTYHSRKIGSIELDIENRVYKYRWKSTPLDYKFDGHKQMQKLISSIAEQKQRQNLVSSEAGQQVYQRPLKVLVFYSPGCRACVEIENEFLPKLEEKYSDAIIIEQYDITIPHNYEQMLRLERLYKVEGGYVPEVITSGYILMGKEEIISKLDGVIENALKQPAELKKNESLIEEAAEYHPPEPSLILSRFESYSIYTVLIAGLLDGINPCAFATIVFFISFLAFLGYGRREMVLAGASFTMAVFIAYLLIGLGIFRFLRAMEGFNFVSSFIHISISILAFLLGALSLVDYIRYKRTGDVKQVILKLPQVIKNRIHSVIGAGFGHEKGRKNTALRIIWIAFSAGFLVSVLESFCTGQVYLPTIAYVLRIPDKKFSAILYLILYNLTFIAPLIAVFLLGLLGVSSQVFSRFMERRLGMIKFSTAVLFFLLGTLLIIF